MSIHEFWSVVNEKLDRDEEIRIRQGTVKATFKTMKTHQMLANDLPLQLRLRVMIHCYVIPVL